MKRKRIYRYFDKYLGIPIVFLMRPFFRGKTTLPKTISRIMFIKFAAIGDVILLTPTIKLLKKKLPDAKIYFISSEINYSIVKKIKYVDKIININVYKFLINPFAFFKFIFFLRRIHIDVVIDVEQWSRINVILTAFMRTDYSIGFKMENQYKHYLYSKYIEHSRTTHEVENFLALLSPLGIKPEQDDLKLEFDLSDEELKEADEFWGKYKLNEYYVVCFQPSTGISGYAREWGDDNYSELGRRLVSRFSNLRILLTGSKDDFERCEVIRQNIGMNVINIAGKNKLGTDVAIVKKADLMICGNTGILHMAASVGTKTIGLHGPNNPDTWGAYDKNAISILSDIYCSPCLYIGHDFGCNAPECMKRIKVDDVYIKVFDCVKEKNID